MLNIRYNISSAMKKYWKINLKICAQSWTRVFDYEKWAIHSIGFLCTLFEFNQVLNNLVI